MSRRRPKGELQFGSDSFLDVVANIVGILIILIVIAGLRVSQTPVVRALAPPSPATAPESGSIPESGSSTKKSQLEISPGFVASAAEGQDLPIAAKESDLDQLPVREPLPELLVPPELAELSARLEAEIALLRDQDAKLITKLKQSHFNQQELIERQKAIRELLAQSAAELEENRKKVAALETDLELARETLVRLARQVEEIEDKPLNIKTLEHKITPVSRVVLGKEKHYRLERNRVAEVPVDELVSRLKEQIDRRKDWLVKTRQHQGLIGPVQGFRMQYLVHVETLSGLEEMKTGHGGYRISLSNWEIHPEPETRGETAEVALRKGSQFYQSILGAAPDTTLTFWVYPDSYEIYRKLQKFTHDHGFSVAGRPLPAGIPISGSPNGSKTSSQ